MAAFSYEYRVPGLFKAPAEVAGVICQQLSDSEAGLSPATLLDASRDSASPLHDDFEWRDDVAAEKYRLGQAQRIIQNLRIIVTREDGGSEKERSFVVTPGGNSANVALTAALTNDEWRKHLLQQARKDAEIFMAKYRRLEELADVNAAMKAFLSERAG